MSEEIVGNLF